MTTEATPGNVPLNDQLGPLSEDPVGVLIRGEGGAWRFSCGEFLLSLYQQPKGDHSLFTEPQVRAMLAAERERCAKLCEQFDGDATRGKIWGSRFAALIRGPNAELTG